MEKQEITEETKSHASVGSAHLIRYWFKIGGSQEGTGKTMEKRTAV